jgi:hypothetical protein
LPEQAPEHRVVGGDTRLLVIAERPEAVLHALGDQAAVVGDWESYWQQASAAGARLRVARVLETSARVPRRPGFGDLWIREDDPQFTRRLRRWARGWLA